MPTIAEFLKTHLDLRTFGCLNWLDEELCLAEIKVTRRAHQAMPDRPLYEAYINRNGDTVAPAEDRGHSNLKHVFLTALRDASLAHRGVQLLDVFSSTATEDSAVYPYLKRLSDLGVALVKDNKYFIIKRDIPNGEMAGPPPDSDHSPPNSVAPSSVSSDSPSLKADGAPPSPCLPTIVAQLSPSISSLPTTSGDMSQDQIPTTVFSSPSQNVEVSTETHEQLSVAPQGQEVGSLQSSMNAIDLNSSDLEVEQIVKMLNDPDFIPADQYGVSSNERANSHQKCGDDSATAATTTSASVIAANSCPVLPEQNPNPPPHQFIVLQIPESSLANEFVSVQCPVAVQPQIHPISSQTHDSDRQYGQCNNHNHAALRPEQETSTSLLNGNVDEPCSASSLSVLPCSQSSGEENLNLSWLEEISFRSGDPRDWLASRVAPSQHPHPLPELELDVLSDELKNLELGTRSKVTTSSEMDRNIDRFIEEGFGEEGSLLGLLETIPDHSRAGENFPLPSQIHNPLGTWNQWDAVTGPKKRTRSAAALSSASNPTSVPELKKTAVTVNGN